MIWKKKGINEYPNIILSDCSISSMHVEKDKIVVNFSEYGFIKKDSKKNKYYFTDGARIVMEGCDIDNTSVKEIRTQHLNEEVYFKTMYDVDVKEFGENINTGKWNLEIVEEFYAVGKGLYIGRIRTKEYNSWCQMKIYYKNMVYLWNDLRYDCPS